MAHGISWKLVRLSAAGQMCHVHVLARLSLLAYAGVRERDVVWQCEYDMGWELACSVCMGRLVLNADDMGV